MADDFKPCPNHELNEKHCTCPSTSCVRHGLCCQCVQNHLKKGNLPMCLRKAE